MTPRAGGGAGGGSRPSPSDVPSLVADATVTDSLFDFVRRTGLALPHAVEAHPWGGCSLKVADKTFAFLHRDATGSLALSLKLPASHPFALMLPGVEPMRYGMGPHGWVTLREAEAGEIDRDLIESWLRESWRAVAPKRLAARLT